MSPSPPRLSRLSRPFTDAFRRSCVAPPAVYVGYWILLVLGAIGIFACSLVLRVEKVSACTEIKKPSVETLCQKMLGNKFIGERQVEKLRNENTTLSKAIINDIIDTQNPNNVGWNVGLSLRFLLALSVTDLRL